MAGKKAVKDLSDLELMNELKSLGLKSGPITPTTRRLFENRLSKALGCDVVDSSCENKDAFSNFDVRECTTSTTSTVDRTNSTSSSSTESPAIFYGVCFDMDCSLSESASPAIPAVFTSKDDALKAAKKVKGSRFKGFKTKLEAELFSRSHVKDHEKSPATPNTSPAPTDPVSNFKTPTPQQIVKFRAVIERGSAEKFQEIVENNPRYLIGPGDTPVILQEGYRYNALHVAVKNNRKEMCQLIVETLESQHFWDVLLNQEIKTATNSKRREFLVDMYLNTPDKGNWEMPLHFACKFGYADIVEYLVSHPLTDTQRPNKHGETPAQVICSRCPNASPELKHQIKSFIEDSFYVPLLGSEDNSTPPWIGGPWSPEVTDDRMNRDSGLPGSPLNTWKQRNSPGELPVTVRAYAGPMSPSKAEEFYRAWKTPPKLEQWNSYIQIKRKDDSRGVERIGRGLAHYGSIPWTEYWAFLGCYADLSSPQGLNKLEDYLASKKERILLSRLSVTPQRVRTVKSVSSVLKTPESRQSSVILNDSGLLHQTSSASDDDSCNENNLLDLSDSSSSSSRKVLFSGSEMEIENLNFELKDAAEEGKPENSKGQHIVETFSSGEGENSSVLSPPLNEITKDEPAVEILAKNLETLCLHQEEGYIKPRNDISFAENSGKKDYPDDNHSTEVRDKKDGTDYVGDFPCKKKLLYSLQEASRKKSFLESKDEDLSDAMDADEEMKIMLAKDKMDIQESYKHSAVLQSITNKEPTSLSPPLASVQNQSPHDLKKTCLEDQVFENTTGVDQRLREHVGTTSSNTEQQSFKVPGDRNVERAKSGSCSNVVDFGNKNISIFIQGLQPSKLDLDVVIAIGQMQIDSAKYPCINQWKKMVMSYSEATQQSWPSPGSPRYHTRHKSLMWSC